MTLMLREASEAANVVQAQIDRNADTVRRIGRKLRDLGPQLIVTCARGSSDHAATYAKYLLENRSGVFVASAAPSIHSVYRTSMHFARSACLVISQSGASPDILAVARAAKKGGAYVVAIVNRTDSPLAGLAHDVIDIRAGAEVSVAATKSFIASLTSVMQLTACWVDDASLHDAIRSAPAKLAEAWSSDWSAATDRIASSRNLYVLGRGIGLGVAQEAALKLKEVCGLHAEAFSAAEVLHGPIAIAGESFPVLVLAQRDETFDGVAGLVADLARRGIALITAGIHNPGAINLPGPDADPSLEPLLRIQSFYRLAAGLAQELGLDPDKPPFLQKVTATI